MIIEEGGYNLICDEYKDGYTVTGYEGSGAILDLSSDDRIISIDRKAFLCCRSLKKVFLPAGIIHIGEWAFSKCDNLQTVKIAGQIRGQIFEKGVFEGCDRLKKIAFDDTDDELAMMLAVSVSSLSKEHLLRADDIGQSFWYEKWDISLLSLIHTDEVIGGNGAPMGGEEDISYDGVSSVDGEMPGPQKNHVKGIGKNKCSLCYMRLVHNRYLANDTEEKLRDYIKERAYGRKDDMAWVTLKEDYGQNPEILAIYLTVVKPDRDSILKMIEDTGAENVQLKAGLIDAAKTEERSLSALDELIL